MSLLRNLFTRSKAAVSPRRRRRLFLESLECRELLAADILITKVAESDTVVAGQNLSYTIRITNIGDEFSEEVRLEDVVPTGTTFVSMDQLSGPGFNEVQTPTPGQGGTVVRSHPSMEPTFENPDDPTRTAVFVLRVRVLPNQTAPVVNTADALTNTDRDTLNNRAQVTTTVTQQYDLQVLSKADAPDPVQAGQNITYTILVQNNGPSDAASATLTDTMPNNTTYVSMQAPSGWTVTPPATPTGTVTATGPLPALRPPGQPGDQPLSFTLIVQVDSTTPGNTTITNIATISDDVPFPQGGSNSASTTTLVQASPDPDLVVTKVDDSDTVAAGGNITYTITLNNAGGVDAANVSLTDTIPADTTFVSFSQVGASTFTLVPPAPGSAGGEAQATIGTFPAGATATFQLVVKVDSDVTQGATITNSATAVTTTTEPNTTNNTEGETTNVIVQADLGVVKNDSPDSVVAGELLTYTIDVSTLGPSDAQTVELRDPLPAGTVLASPVIVPSGWQLAPNSVAVGQNGTVIAQRATLPAGTATGTFTISVRVSPSATGTLVNTATIDAATLDPVVNNDESTTNTPVQVNADLSVTKTDNSPTVQAGTNNTYIITVTNSGPSDAVNVTLTDTLPANATYVSMTQQAGGPTFTIDDDTPGVVTATAASMPAGSTATFTLVVTVNAGLPNGTPVINSVQVVSASDVNTTNNDAEDTSLVGPPPRPDIVVTKNDSPDPVVAGSQITYTITVTNAGLGAASTVNFTDVVPANTTFVSLSQTSGPSFTLSPPPPGSSGTTASATRASMAPSDTAVFSMVVLVGAGATGSITNTATANTANDENTANNSAVASTVVQSRADLSVAKSDSPDPVSAGGTITYTITVTNAGPSNAINTQLSDAIPENTTFVSMTQTSGPTFTNINRPPVGSGGTVTASTSSFPSGATATFTLVVRADNDLFSGVVITNTATVSTSSTDPNAGNNSANTTTGIVVPPDFGDAPASYGTLQVNNGARHPVGVLRLGSLVDFEPDGQPSAAANGDDLAGIDDEDGVVTPLGIIPGRGAAAIVTASAVGRLDAWIDFNRNGTFDAGEKIADSLLVAPGANTIFFTAPADAVVGDTYARFRISTAGGLGPTGAALDGEVEDYATRIFTVTPGQVGIVPDPELPGQNMLLVMGTAANDTITVTQLRTHLLRVQVTVNGRSRGVFPMANFRRIVVFAGAGNDTVNIGLARPAVLHGEEGNDRLNGGGGFDELYGGPGNDSLNGGGGDDYLFGGDGNDSLNGGNGNDVMLGGAGRDTANGGSGRDLLIGGLGVDTLNGGAGDDILIGGTTSHDENRAALAAIMAEWGSKAAFHPRVNNLGGLINAGTVQDDAARDRLTGATERDWYLDYLLADSLVGFNRAQDRRN